MPFPKLSPLQSRLAVSLIASILVLLLYFALSSPHFAYASEVDSLQSEDHNHERLLRPYILDGDLDEFEINEVRYEPEFPAFDRGIIGRAPAGVTALTNNVPDLINVPQGSTVQYVFENASLWGPLSAPAEGLPPSERLRDRDIEYDDQDGLVLARQASTRTLYITFNTCLQPYNPNDPSGSLGPPPQLELYVDQSPNNTKPGPSQLSSSQQKVVAEKGFANFTVQATGDVYIGVAAPNTTTYTDVYNVQIAASIDAPYHSYNSTDPNLFFIDSDTSSALLATKNLTTALNGSSYNEWMNITPPFVVFATNQNDSLISGVQNSYCGLEKYSQIAGTKGGVRTNMVQTSMTNVTLGPYPKQQFYFQGLNRSSSYFGMLAMTGNSTVSGPGVVGGGGRVWQTMNFTTQSDGNCAVIFNLTFCNSVAYAVPGNPNTFPDVTDLANFYDSAAQAQYTNFDFALQQIPCEIASTGQYSLARNCSDCASAYKDWLCSVTIPRCMDFSSAAPWLLQRNVVQSFPNGTKLDDDTINAAQSLMYLNSSRNPNIDVYVQPGPYKEILPCEDLCYNLVQSCPSSMGFGCPQPGQMGFNYSYGQRPDGSVEQTGQITCNYPGAAYDLSAGNTLRAPLLWAIVTFIGLGTCII